MDTDHTKASNAPHGLQEPAHAPVHHRAKHRKPKAAAPPATAEQPWFVRLYTGVEMNPIAVAIFRQVLYLLLSAGISLAIAYFRNVPPLGDAANFTIILTACNGLQGVVDKYLKGDASAAAPKGNTS